MQPDRSWIHQLALIHAQFDRMEDRIEEGENGFRGGRIRSTDTQTHGGVEELLQAGASQDGQMVVQSSDTRSLVGILAVPGSSDVLPQPQRRAQARQEVPPCCRPDRKPTNARANEGGSVEGAPGSRECRAATSWSAWHISARAPFMTGGRMDPALP